MRAKLTRKFIDTGYDATPMVPCSELNDIFDLQGLPGAVFCSREEEAVAVGAGMHIAGRQPLVLMQSSGLMSSLNTVGSLLVAYALPVTLLVAMRGGADEQNPTQVPTGRAVQPSLEALGCVTITCCAGTLLSTLRTIRLNPISNASPTVVLLT